MEDFGDDRNGDFDETGLFICRIPSQIDKKQLESLLAAYGKLVNFHFIPEKRFCFCNYKNKESAAKAKRELNEISPLNLVVKYRDNKFKKDLNRSSPRMNSQKPAVNLTPSPVKMHTAPIERTDHIKAIPSIKPPSVASDSDRVDQFINDYVENNNPLKCLKKLMDSVDRFKNCQCFKNGLPSESVLPELNEFNVKLHLNFEVKKCPNCDNNRYGMEIYSKSYVNSQFDVYNICPDVELKTTAPTAVNYLENFTVFHREIGETFQLEMMRLLNNKTWICSSPDSFWVESCALIFEFQEVCKAAVKVSRNINYNKLVSVLTDGQWNRAMALPNDSFALIDKGNVVDKKAIASIIQCPEEYEQWPALIFMATLKSDTRQNDTFTCSVEFKDDLNKTMVLKSSYEVLFYIQPWNPQKINADVDTCIKSPVNNSTKPVQEYKFIENTISSGDTVAVVRYVDPTEVYIRKADDESNKAFKTILDEANIDGEKAKPVPDDLGDIKMVYCKDSAGLKYYRGRVTSYNLKEDTFTIDFIDLGKSEQKSRKELKTFTSPNPNVNNYLKKISIGGVPNMKNQNCDVLFRFLIMQEVLFTCNFGQLTNNAALLYKKDGVSLAINMKKCFNISDTDSECDNSTNSPVDIPLIDLNPDGLSKFKAFCGGIFIPEARLIYLTRLGEIMDSLGELNKNIKAYAEKNAAYQAKVGDYVIAQFIKDKEWYRGLVTKSSRSSFNVHFIDYGNDEVITSDKIRKLPDQFKSLPRMARKCYIPDFPVKFTDVKEVEALLCSKMLTVEIIKEEADCIHIKLPNTMKTLTERNLIR